MFGFTATPKASFTAGGKTINLNFPTDYVAVSRRFVPEISIDSSDMVFVGYGIVAPEYGWDDYKDVDVTGKTIMPPIFALHGHLALTSGLVNSGENFNEENIAAKLDQWASYGVLHVVSMGTDKPGIWDIRSRQRAGEELACLEPVGLEREGAVGRGHRGATCRARGRRGLGYRWDFDEELVADDGG